MEENTQLPEQVVSFDNSQPVVDKELEHLADFVKTMGGEEALEVLNARVAKEMGAFKVKTGDGATQDAPVLNVADAQDAPAAEVKAKATDAPAVTDNDELDSPFLKKKVAPTQINTLDELKAAIKSFGTEDPTAYLESSKKWREDSMALQKTTEEVDQLKKMYQELPDELATAIVEYYSAKDWRSTLGQTINNHVDYSLPFDKQDLKKLAAVYDPDTDLSAVDLTDTTDVGVKFLTKSIQRQYELDKTQRESRRATVTKEQEAKANQFTESVTGSVNALSTSLPLKKEQVGEIQKILKSGNQGVASIFFDKNGAYLPTAAKSAFYAKYGEAEIAKLVTIIEKQQADMKELLGKGGTQPKVGHKQDGVLLDSELKDIENFFGFNQNNNPYEMKRKPAAQKST